MADDDPVCGAPTTGSQPCQNPAGENGHCWIPSHNPDSDGENPHGRPTKLTKDTADRITSSIAEGKSVESAARMEAIHPATVYAWVEKGEPTDGPPADEREFEDDPHGYFHDRFVRARGLGEDTYVAEILEIAREEGDLATLMSMLKQRYPESWGDVDRGEQVADLSVTSEVVEVTEDTIKVE